MVAIVSILSTIAVTNYLRAQVRGKVVRAKIEMRSLATALEAYHVDYGFYPPPASSGHGARMWRLSTPVAYIADPKKREPFEDDARQRFPPYGYHGRNVRVSRGFGPNFNGP